MAVEISRSEGDFKDEKGRRLYYQTWTPADIIAQMVIVHGSAEHMGYYDSFADEMCKAGILVHLIDLPGHGKSEGIRGYIENFDEFSGALQQLNLHNSAFQRTLPTFMMGHSMGALAILRYCLQSCPNLKGLILLSPLLGFPCSMEPVRLICNQIRRHTSEMILPKPLGIKKLSRSSEARMRYITDPYRVNTFTPELVENYFKFAESVQRDVGSLSYPVLCFYSQKDKVVSPRAIEKFIKKYPANDKTSVVYTQAMHELMQEEEKGEISQKIRSWIKQRS